MVTYTCKEYSCMRNIEGFIMLIRVKTYRVISYRPITCHKDANFWIIMTVVRGWCSGFEGKKRVGCRDEGVNLLLSTEDSNVKGGIVGWCTSSSNRGWGWKQAIVDSSNTDLNPIAIQALLRSVFDESTIAEMIVLTSSFKVGICSAISNLSKRSQRFNPMNVCLVDRNRSMVITQSLTSFAVPTDRPRSTDWQ